MIIMKFSKSALFDIVYGYEPMSKTLAETIKKLRCEDKLLYEELPGVLSEGFGNDFALGKELCVKAKMFLKESGKEWD